MKKTVQLEMTEMQNADVHFISMVDRGANRIPFRILKSEDEKMFNLSTLFRQKQEEPLEILGVAVSKGSDLEAMVAKLSELGITVQKTLGQEDNDLMVTKADADFTNATAVRVSDDIVVFTEARKGFTSWPDSSSFMETVTASGFYPSMRVALESAGDIVSVLLQKSNTPPVEDVRKAMGELTEYMVGLVSTLPQVAFKLDDLKKITKQETTETTTETSDTTGATVEKSEDDTTASTEVTTEEETTEEGTTVTTEEEPKKEDATPAEAITVDTITQMITTSIERANATFQEMLLSTFAPLQASVAKIDTIANSVEELQGRVVKAEEAVTGTIIGQSVGEDTQAPARKSDESKASVFDSAFKFPGLED